MNVAHSDRFLHQDSSCCGAEGQRPHRGDGVDGREPAGEDGDKGDAHDGQNGLYSGQVEGHVSKLDHLVVRVSRIDPLSPRHQHSLLLLLDARPYPKRSGVGMHSPFRTFLYAPTRNL